MNRDRANDKAPSFRILELDDESWLERFDRWEVRRRAFWAGIALLGLLIAVASFVRTIDGPVAGFRHLGELFTIFTWFVCLLVSIAAFAGLVWMASFAVWFARERIRQAREDKHAP